MKIIIFSIGAIAIVFHLIALYKVIKNSKLPPKEFDKAIKEASNASKNAQVIALSIFLIILIIFFVSKG